MATAAGRLDHGRRRPGVGAPRLVPAGYRVWVSTDVGTVTETADGITARPLEGGTLITAPDEWDAATVALAVNATLDANELHDIHRSPEHPTA